MNTNKIATGSVSKKLLAALAVLAVAFVVLAAVPAVATDSDAVSEANPAPSQPTNAIDWSDIDASGTGYTYASNVLTVSQDIAITVDKIITSNLTISKASSASNVTVYLMLSAEGSTIPTGSTASSSNSNGMFSGTRTASSSTGVTASNQITLTVNSGVNLVLLDGRSASSHAISEPMMIYTDLAINNANVWIESAKTATTTAFNFGGITMVGGKLVAHSNGIIVAKNLTLSSGARIIAENNQYRDYSKTTSDLLDQIGITFEKGDYGKVTASIAKGCSVTLTDGFRLMVRGTSTMTIEGTVAADMYMNGTAEVTIKNGGSYTGTIASYGDDKAKSMMNIDTTLSSTDSEGLAATMTSSSDTETYLTLSGKGTVGDTSVTYGAYYAKYNSAGTKIETTGSADFGADLRVSGTGVSVAAGATISVDRGAALSTPADGTTTSTLGLGNGSKIVLDADQRQPVTFVSSGTSSITSVDSGITQNSGSITLSTGSFNVNSSYGMTLTAGTFTVAKGAAIKVDGNSGLTVTSGSIVNNGVIAYSGTIPTGDDLKALRITGNDIVKAYAVIPISEMPSNVKSISLGPDTVAYEGEIIDVDASAADHHKLTAVAYYDTTDSKATILARATDNGDGTWSFTMPAKAITVTASAVGAYTATFLEVDDATGKIIGQTESDPLDDAKSVPVPAISVNGYTVGGYYQEKALYNAYKLTDSDTKITVSDSNLYSSVTIFVKMLKQYTITYADVEGGEVYGAIQAQSKTDVTVTAAQDSGYKFKANSVQAVYTDADGKQVTIKATAVSRGSTQYTFEMPAADVTVSATFDKLYSATFVKQATADPKSTVTVGSESDAKTNVADVVTSQAIKGGDISFTVSMITTDYAVSGFTFKDTAGNTLEISVTESTETPGSYTFKMPGQDVTVSVELGKAYALTVSTTENGKTVATTSAGQTINEGDDNKLVAVNADVTITATPDKGKALKTITVAATDDSTKTIEPVLSNGVYTFKMPEYKVTVTTEYDTAYSVSGVAIRSGINGGSVDYDQNAAKAIAAGNTFSFSIELRAGYSLTSIEATVPTGTQDYTAASTGTSPAPATIKIIPNVTDGTETIYDMVYPSAGTNTSMFTYDKTTGTVTMLMPAANVTSVVFGFSATTYYTVTLNAGEAGSIVLYSDAACTEVLEDAQPDVDGFQVESGKTVYVKVAAENDGTIESINATYQRYVRATTQGTTIIPAHYATTALDLGIVSSTSSNGYHFGIYSFAVQGDTTINATFAKSALQIAKDDATKYIQGIQASASMSETIVGHDATWAAQADADAKVFANALSAVAAATTVADVQKAQSDFDSRLLSYLKETSASYLETAYNNGEALDGKILAVDAYTTATNTIAAVQLDDDKTVQDEADAVVAAYDTAMNSRTDVNPTPTPGTKAATEVTVSIILRNGSYNVQVLGLDGYVPAGTITVTALYQSSVGALPFSFDLTISADDVNTASSYQLVPIVNSNAHASAVFAGSASYSSADGSIAATASGIAGMAVAAPAAAQTEVAATTEE